MTMDSDQHSQPPSSGMVCAERRKKPSRYLSARNADGWAWVKCGRKAITAWTPQLESLTAIATAVSCGNTGVHRTTKLMDAQQTHELQERREEPFHAAGSVTAAELLERAHDMLARAHIMLDGWQQAVDWHHDSRHRTIRIRHSRKTRNNHQKPSTMAEENDTQKPSREAVDPASAGSAGLEPWGCEQPVIKDQDATPWLGQAVISRPDGGGWPLESGIVTEGGRGGLGNGWFLLVNDRYPTGILTHTQEVYPPGFQGCDLPCCAHLKQNEPCSAYAAQPSTKEP